MFHNSLYKLAQIQYVWYSCQSHNFLFKKNNNKKPKVWMFKLVRKVIDETYHIHICMFRKKCWTLWWMSVSYPWIGSIYTLPQGHHNHLFLLLEFLQDTLHSLQKSNTDSSRSTNNCLPSAFCASQNQAYLHWRHTEWTFCVIL